MRCEIRESRKFLHGMNGQGLCYKVEAGALNRIVDAETPHAAVRKAVTEHVGHLETELDLGQHDFYQPHDPISPRVRVYEARRLPDRWEFADTPVLDDSIENALASTPRTSPKLVFVLVDPVDAFRRVSAMSDKIEKLMKLQQPKKGIIRRLIEAIR